MYTGHERDTSGMNYKKLRPRQRARQKSSERQAHDSAHSKTDSISYMKTDPPATGKRLRVNTCASHYRILFPTPSSPKRLAQVGPTLSSSIMMTPSMGAKGMNIVVSH